MVSQKETFGIAILVQDDVLSGNTPENVVKYCNLDWCKESNSTETSVIAFDNLPETYFISSCEKAVHEKNASPLIKSCSKSFHLSHVASYDASTFLSGKYPRFLSQKKGSLITSSNTPSISTEPAVLVLSRNDCADSTFRPSQYHAFKFSFPQATLNIATTTDELRSYRQMLMIRQPGLQRSGPMSLSKDLWSFDAFDVVEICTGMCLFSEPNLDLCTNDGTIQPERLAELPISLSEMEIIARLSMTIANTAALYLCGNEPRRQHSLRINIDIPSVQYYKDAFDSFSSGTCEPSEVLAWIKAIKDRRHLLFQAFKKAIEYGLRERGLPEDSAYINLSCGLKAVDEFVFCKLRAPSGTTNWIQEILEHVSGDATEFWSEFIDLCAENERKPNSWRQFSTLSYMYEVAKPVLRARSVMNTSSIVEERHSTSETECSNYAIAFRAKSAPPSPKLTCTKQQGYFDATAGSKSTDASRILLLAIDDSDEGRIYTKAYQSLCRLSTASARSPGLRPVPSVPIITRILTICPAPQVIVGTTCASSDWKRPSLWRATLRRGDVLVKTLRFRTENGMSQIDTDVLKKVYDQGLVAQLEKWLQK